MVSSLSRTVTFFFVSNETSNAYWLENQTLMAAPLDERGFHTDNACQVDFDGLDEKDAGYAGAIGYRLAYKRQNHELMEHFVTFLLTVKELHDWPISNDQIHASELDFALPAKVLV